MPHPVSQQPHLRGYLYEDGISNTCNYKEGAKSFPGTKQINWWVLITQHLVYQEKRGFPREAGQTVECQWLVLFLCPKIGCCRKIQTKVALWFTTQRFFRASGKSLQYKKVIFATSLNRNYQGGIIMQTILSRSFPPVHRILPANTSRLPKSRQSVFSSG